MSLPIYARPMYFGPIGINATTLAIALVVFGIALFLKLRHKQTKLFEVTLLIFLLGFVFQTFHGVIIQQYLFPISLPERPLFDNGLTLNYTLTNAVAYTVVPVLAICLEQARHNRRRGVQSQKLETNSRLQRCWTNLCSCTLFGDGSFFPPAMGPGIHHRRRDPLGCACQRSINYPANHILRGHTVQPVPGKRKHGAAGSRSLAGIPELHV